MIYKLILNLLLIIFSLYGLMALFISLRDLLITKGSRLWISVLGVGIGVATLLFATTYLPAIALPITLMISLPIFITDKRRNWDKLDQIFRWVSLASVLGALFLFLNYYFLR